MSPASDVPPPADWLWTTSRGRLFAGSVAFVALGLAWWVKWGGLRDGGWVGSGAARWVLGWSPSFLAALALPYLAPLFGRRLLPRAGASFVPECAAAGAILELGELSDLLVPRVGATAVQTFAIGDAIAIPVGAVSAWTLAWLLRPVAGAAGR